MSATDTPLRRRRDPARADPRGSGRDLRGDGRQRHPDLALRDRQERDGLLDGALRRRRARSSRRVYAAESARGAAGRGGRRPARVRRDLVAGDVVMVNDPFAGGMHLPDIFVVKPVFRRRRLVAIVATVAHHADLGGLVPGRHVARTPRMFPGGSADPAAAALRGWRARARRFRAPSRQHPRPRDRAWRHGGAVGRL